jgi:hypothetical protein
MIYSMTQLKQISRIKQKLKNNLFANSKIFSKLLLNVRLNTVQKYSVGVVNENKRQQDQYLTLRLLIENHFSTEYAKLHIHVFAQFFFIYFSLQMGSLLYRKRFNNESYSRVKNGLLPRIRTLGK